MKRSIKIILGVVLGLVVAGVALFLTQGNFVQGLMRPAYDANKCYDSDGGKTYETKGTTYGKMTTRSKQTQYTDSCDGDTLVEYYCDGTKVKKEEKECGKCIDSKCDTEYCNQTEFKTAFILLVEDMENINPEVLDKADFYREQTSTAFAEATNNLASMDTSTPLFIMETEDTMFDELKKLTHQDIITNNFYETNPDDYDFIIVFTAFDSNGAPSNYMGVTNQIEGIGIPLGDSTLSMGSEGQLKGVIVLYDWHEAIAPPQYVTSTSHILHFLIPHEIGHYWGVYVGDKFSGDGSEELGLKDYLSSYHFYGGLESPYETGTLMGANYFIPSGNGTFVINNDELGIKKYHPFMLYFMGLLPESEYGTKYQIYDLGPAYNATPYKQVSVNDIIAVEGERKCK
ncbi:MAG: hypothetical protein WC604_01720 [Candidatus Gracilibacteria bacterium]